MISCSRVNYNSVSDRSCSSSRHHLSALQLAFQLPLERLQELGADRCRDDGGHATSGYELNGFLVLESDDLWQWRARSGVHAGINAIDVLRQS